MYSPILFLVILLLKKDTLASIQPYINDASKLEGRILDILVGPGPGVPVPAAQPNTVGANPTVDNPDIDVHLGLTSLSGSSGTGGTVVGAGLVLPPSIIIQRGVNCGYVQLNPNDVVQISSRNYNVSNYYNNEACTWKFEGSRCTLSTWCPCVDFPPSPFCLEDYLRITDKYNFDQRYCGGKSPGSNLVSESDTLTIRYRTDRRITATGFVCYVFCTAPTKVAITSIEEGKTCPTPVTANRK